MESDKRLEAIQQEIDALKSELEDQKGPWYTKASNVIAALALAFSAGTTIFSYVNAYNANLLADKREVLAILQRITRLPIDNFEAMNKYGNSPYGPQLVSLINEEALLLLDQADSLMEKHPGEYTSTQNFSVATAMLRSRPTARVLELLERALKKAGNASEYSVASRAIGRYYFSVREPQLARKYFQQALDVWRLYPEINAAVRNSMDAQTLLLWAGSEASVGNVADAEKQVNQVEVLLNRLPGGLETGVIRNQVQMIRDAIQQARAFQGGGSSAGAALLSPGR